MGRRQRRYMRTVRVQGLGPRTYAIIGIEHRLEPTSRPTFPHVDYTDRSISFLFVRCSFSIREQPTQNAERRPELQQQQQHTYQLSASQREPAHQSVQLWRQDLTVSPRPSAYDFNRTSPKSTLTERGRSATLVPVWRQRQVRAATASGTSETMSNTDSWSATPALAASRSALSSVGSPPHFVGTEPRTPACASAASALHRRPIGSAPASSLPQRSARSSQYASKSERHG
ncbi:unnamed protein product [Tilletia controversa]|nr:unnamed protein product [Tilletia controversa]CAD6980327.1 unnamed protein product [Tilletia controversa]